MQLLVQETLSIYVSFKDPSSSRSKKYYYKRRETSSNRDALRRQFRYRPRESDGQDSILHCRLNFVILEGIMIRLESHQEIQGTIKLTLTPCGS